MLTARLGSSRLKKKHLLNINNQPILSYLINRIGRAFRLEINEGKVAIVIATADQEENKQFEMFCKQQVSVFYGALDNIPLRHLQAAERYNFDNLISVDGDDILCSVEGMRQVYHELINKKEFVKTIGLPFGMNVMGYATEFLKTSLEDVKDQVLETGWGRIFNETDKTVLTFDIFNCNDYMRFTLDYPEDFIFFENFITQFPGDLNNSTDQEIVDFVIKKKLYEITKPITSEYWNNFNSGVEEEINKKVRC
ncbi:cytidylyltransferase domain-containing protein [Pelosinus fermentans]|uniref:cytidylyltransferase domain-containing protein n=1 Tax=Pelosinus fermentans TaxID=365349 RepID=UPI00139033A4|nr:hypothetical protein [Pelosinus fermentans]